MEDLKIALEAFYLNSKEKGSENAQHFESNNKWVCTSLHAQKKAGLLEWTVKLDSLSSLKIYIYLGICLKGACRFYNSWRRACFDGSLAEFQTKMEILLWQRAG